MLWLLKTRPGLLLSLYTLFDLSVCTPMGKEGHFVQPPAPCPSSPSPSPSPPIHAVHVVVRTTGQHKLRAGVGPAPHFGFSSVAVSFSSTLNLLGNVALLFVRPTYMDGRGPSPHHLAQLVALHAGARRPASRKIGITNTRRNPVTMHACGCVAFANALLFLFVKKVTCPVRRSSPPPHVSVSIAC